MNLKIDHNRINAAIAQAETATSGEITCVIKGKALNYGETPLGWAAASALILPLVLAGLDALPQHLLSTLLANILGWYAIGVSGEFQTWEIILTYAILQIVVFSLVYALINFTGLKLALTPKATRRRKAHEKAMEQFYARGLHLTRGRTGVMIFCALQERFVEVIADEGIFSKVDTSTWNNTVNVLLKNIKAGDLTTGFVEAVAACGVALAQHFPPDADNPNELPDVLIEI
jgi:putative membrane protein